MNKSERTLALIKEQSMLPLFYHDDQEVSLEVVRALYSGGARLVEYTNRGKAALKNFEFLKNKIESEMPGMELGIGTIRRAEDAKEFISVGADFIVCPVINEEVGTVIREKGILWIPGCQTATEIDRAERAGAKLVKVFPGSILGPGFISAVKEVFPEVLFMPTGGVEPEEENIKAWFKSGAISVGMGSKLISKSIFEEKNYPALTDSTKQILTLIKSCKK